MLERALRLGPRDPFRAEWQYRLALAHWGAGRYELARDWSQSAANTTPTLVWPPIHAAAMHRLGQIDQARQAFAEHTQRHPGYTAAQIVNRMPGVEPGLRGDARAAARARAAVKRRACRRPTFELPRAAVRNREDGVPAPAAYAEVAFSTGVRSMKCLHPAVACTTRTALALAAGALMLHGSVQAQTWLLDSFDDDTPGLTPNDPEIGSVYRACDAGLTCDKYTVVGSAGDGQLHVNGEAQGLGLQWFLSSPASGRGTVSYRFTPLPGGTVSAANAFNLSLNLAPFGTNATLMFGDEGAAGLSLRFGFTNPGDSSYTLQLLPITALRGREMRVQWAFDTDTERVDLSLDGQWLASKTFAGGLDNVFATSAVSNFATTAGWLIDDVQAQAVPEPASLALMLAGIGAIAARAQRKIALIATTLEDAVRCGVR